MSSLLASIEPSSADSRYAKVSTLLGWLKWIWLPNEMHANFATFRAQMETLGLFSMFTNILNMAYLSFWLQVVANIPFNISTDVVKQLLPMGDIFSVVVLLLQVGNILLIYDCKISLCSLVLMPFSLFGDVIWIAYNSRIAWSFSRIGKRVSRERVWDWIF